MAKKNRRHDGGGGEKGGGSPPEQKVTEGKSEDDAKARDSVAKEWTKSLLVAVVLFVVIRTFVLQTFVITSGSMEGCPLFFHSHPNSLLNILNINFPSLSVSTILGCSFSVF